METQQAEGEGQGAKRRRSLSRPGWKEACMVIETPIIEITNPSERARGAKEGTLRFWHSRGTRPIRKAPLAPTKRKAALPGRRYPTNPLLRARFGAVDQASSKFRLALALLAITGFIATGIAAFATVKGDTDQRPPGSDHMAELLPLEAPQLGFEFVRTAAPELEETPVPRTPRNPKADVRNSKIDVPAPTPVIATNSEPIADNPY